MSLKNPPTENTGKIPVIRRFDSEKKLFLAACIGMFYTPSEITEAFEKKYGVRQNFEKFKYVYAKRKKWQGLIEKTRKEYLSDIQASAGFHKRVRLDKAERVYDRAVKAGQLNVQVSAIEQMRREFDRHENNQLIVLQQQYNFMTDEEITERKKYLIEKLGNLKKEITDGASGVSVEKGS